MYMPILQHFYPEQSYISHKEFKMKEEEKIFSGNIFDCTDPALISIKHKAHSACRQFNMMDEYDPGRNDLIRGIFGSIGENFYFQGPVQFNYGTHTFIGNDFFANFGLTVLDDNRVFIGDNVLLGPNVSIMAGGHPLIADERSGRTKDGRYAFAEYAQEIHIGSNVWIGAGALILGGVSIGSGSVIGGGSVVTKNVPADCLAYGSPCRTIRPITSADSKTDLILPEDRKHFDFI